MARDPHKPSRRHEKALLSRPTAVKHHLTADKAEPEVSREKREAIQKNVTVLVFSTTLKC